MATNILNENNLQHNVTLSTPKTNNILHANQEMMDSSNSDDSDIHSCRIG